jgi:hypothetical protein
MMPHGRKKIPCQQGDARQAAPAGTVCARSRDGGRFLCVKPDACEAPGRLSRAWSGRCEDFRAISRAAIDRGASDS